MSKDRSGTHLDTTAAARVRYPVCRWRVYVGGTWLNRTSDVLDWNLVRARPLPGDVAVGKAQGTSSQLSIHLHNWYGDGPIYSEKFLTGPLGAGVLNGLYKMPCTVDAGFYYRSGGTVGTVTNNGQFAVNFSESAHFWDGGGLLFISGGLQGWYKPITSWSGGVITTSSPFWAAPQSGDRVIAAKPEMLRQFTGVIAETPSNTAALHELRLVCYGTGELIARKKVNTKTAVNQTIDQWTTHIAEISGLVDGTHFISSGADRTLDPGYTKIPVIWEYNSDPGSQMDLVAASEAAVRFFGDDGLLYLWAANHIDYDPPTGGPAPVVYAFDAGRRTSSSHTGNSLPLLFSHEITVIPSSGSNVEDIQFRVDSQRRCQRVRVERAVRTITPLEVVFTLRKTIVLAPGEVRKITADFTKPVDSDSLVAPVTRTDYFATSTPAGGDYTATVSVGLDNSYMDVGIPYAQSVRLILSNHGTEQAFVSFCQVRGYPYVGLPNEEFVLDIDAPPGISQDETWSVTNIDYIQEDDQCALIAAIVEKGYKTPHAQATVLSPAIPWLDPLDLCTVNDPRTGWLNQYMRIQSIDSTFDARAGWYRQSTKLVQADLPGASAPGQPAALIYFIPGHAVYGVLSGAYVSHA